jgi:hypothetical protein
VYDMSDFVLPGVVGRVVDGKGRALRVLRRTSCAATSQSFELQVNIGEGKAAGLRRLADFVEASLVSVPPQPKITAVRSPGASYRRPRRPRRARRAAARTRLC